MRILLHEVKVIEEHLFAQSEPAERLLFSANLLLNTGLRDKVALQQSAYQTIKQYGRLQLKAEIEAVHQKLADEPRGFMKRVMALFK